MRLTYYLFRRSVTSFNQVWRDGDRPPADYQHVTLRETLPYEAEAYLLPNRPTTPDWWAFVEPFCRVDGDRRPLNRSSSFVLLVKAKDRIFAATFGHGFAALDRSALESDFGLKVALNSVDPGKLRSLQARNIDPTTVSRQVVVNRDAALSVFDVDFYQDLLSKIEGVPARTSFARRVAGADACYLTSDISLPNVARQCATLLRYYGSKHYAEAFPFVDQIRQVTSKDIKAALDARLAAAFQGRRYGTLAFALPDISEYERVRSYRVSRGRWSYDCDELDAQRIIAEYNAGHPGAIDQADVRISALDEAGEPVTEFTLRRCAVFEIKHRTRLFVLTLDQWYEVDAEYAALVDASVAKLHVRDHDRFLPSIRHGMSEGAYNERAARTHHLALLDKKLVRPAGPASAIEVCDLFSRNREFVHVKRHTRSATLSHLLAQGTVSARLFLDDQGYRQSFRNALPPRWRGLVGVRSVSPEMFTVVSAITAAPDLAIPGGLPFFTKVNLLFHCREIERMGMLVRVCHIPETREGRVASAPHAREESHSDPPRLVRRRNPRRGTGGRRQAIRESGVGV
jgi:uncharacterized protein (TIGR04141 family)